jgi:hypothetical protein
MNDAMLNLIGSLIGHLMNKQILDIEEVRNMYFEFGEGLGLTRDQAVQTFGEVVQELNNER